jgi:FKBP-type peptidyl-prolyl cis-trans isomerase FkpA
MRFAFAVLVAALLAGCPSGGSAGKSEVKLQTEDQKVLYAIGLVEAQRLHVFALKPDELDFVKKGLTDSLTGVKPEVELSAYGPKISELVKARAGARAEADKVKADAEKVKGVAFLEAAAKEAGAVKLESGLIFKDVTPGTGASPVAADTVKVNYRGTLIDGTEFDSSYKRNQPAEFPLGGVIKCWTEGVQKMKVGGKARLVCPSSIAYGDGGHPPTIPGGATLIFEVELLEVKGK